MSMATIIELDSLRKDFGGLSAVLDVSLSLIKGGITGLVGPNGAGKTTLFNLISGFLKPTSGSIYFEGEEVTNWPVHRRVQAGITRTFQGNRVFPGLTVRENVVTGTYSASSREVFGDKQEPDGRGRVDWILRALKLEEYSDYLGGNLSYGYKRRLELAIAIATQPRLLLLDEPFSGTHFDDLQDLTKLLKGLSSEGLTVVLVEHDIGSVASLADNIIYMDGGRVTIPNG